MRNRAEIKKWTSAERKIVFAVYPVKGPRGVSDLLVGRSPDSIRSFASRNGIVVTRPPKPETVARRLGPKPVDVDPVALSFPAQIAPADTLNDRSSGGIRRKHGDVGGSAWRRI